MTTEYTNLISKFLKAFLRYSLKVKVAAEKHKSKSERTDGLERPMRNITNTVMITSWILFLQGANNKKKTQCIVLFAAILQFCGNLNYVTAVVINHAATLLFTGLLHMHTNKHTINHT